MKLFWKHAAFILVPVLSLTGSVLGQASYSLLSPDKRIEVRIRTLLPRAQNTLTSGAQR